MDRFTATNEECAALGALHLAARKRSGMNLKDYAGAIGRSINTVRRHEAGNLLFRLDDMAQAARVLKVPMATLYELPS